MVREIDVAGIGEVLREAEAEDRRELVEPEVYRILEAAGVAVPAFVTFAAAKEITPRALAPIPTPLAVVKVVSPAIKHKTEFGGVRVVECDAEQIREIHRDFERLAEVQDLGPIRTLVCEKVEMKEGPAAELLLSLRMDRGFGPSVAFGLGGVLTEYWGRSLKEGRAAVTRATSGLDRRSIEEMIAGTVAADFLAGRLRGQRERLVEPGAAEEAVETFADLARAFSPRAGTSWTLEELEVNPLVIDATGRLVALDGIGRFSRVKRQPLPRPVEAIKALLEPRSVLVVGASSRSLNPGRIILRNLLSSSRYTAQNVHLVHPAGGEIEGVPCVRDLEELPDGIDMAILTVPAGEKTVDLIEELTVRGKVRTFTLITSGFGETEKGRRLQERLERIIRESRTRPDGGILVNGPNCLGIISAPGDYNTFFLPPYKLAIHKDRAGGANLASVSQSGAFLVCQISRLGEYITPRYSISFGNQVDVSVADYVSYMAGEEQVQVISVYVEGFQEYGGEELLNAGRRARDKGKTLIIYKTGRTEAGAKAASSHTAAIVGNYTLVQQCFEHMGALVAPDLETFEEWTQVFALLGEKEVTGTGLGMITNAGFETTVGSDRLGRLRLVEFGKETWARMHGLLPEGIIDFRNPVDTSPQCDTAGFMGCVEAMDEDPAVECLLVSAVPCTPALDNLPAGEGHPDDLAGADSYASRLIRFFARTRKPLVTVVDAGATYDPLVDRLRRGGLPVFRKIDRAAQALSVFVAHRLRRRGGG